jgi:PKD repeat protein
LNQINVPAAHTAGYDGSGVTLAIFDTGFRKTHQAFAQHYADGRVLGEWDFINEDGNTANEGGDQSSQWNHGTLIWSVSGGNRDGSIYGPAYKANFLLAKTEDVASETPVEEDNWVAALEWADSAGADVITSSLGYSDWYTYADFDGNTATITLAANTAAGLGIVLCNSMGNSGPAAGTLTAPADAFDMIAVGAVSSSGTIASFSSRGPTFDGRMKPEVCAQGVSTYSASSSGDALYTTASGTSLSTPLVAGAACLLVQARPSFTPQLIRQAFMETASRANTPDNTYGWGIINMMSALAWGADFEADNRVGTVPFTANFTSETSLSPISYAWDFGDGGSSTLPNPSHLYTLPGEYTVTLTLTTAGGPITNEKIAYIAAIADTLRYEADSAYAGQSVTLSVNLTNSQSLERIIVPFQYGTLPAINFDSALAGSRTAYFERIQLNWIDAGNRRFAVDLLADNGGGAPPLAPGSGEILKLYFTINPNALGDLTNIIDTAIGVQSLKLSTSSNTYAATLRRHHLPVL